MGRAAKPDTAVVIEPRPDLREFVAVLLEETGYSVRASASIEDALAMIEADATNVAVLFADLPGAAIAGAARSVARKWPWVRVIVPCQRGNADGDRRDSALRAPCPWNALDILIEAERARQSPTTALGRARR